MLDLSIADFARPPRLSARPPWLKPRDAGRARDGGQGLRNGEYLKADCGMQNVELEYLQSAICNQNESKIQNLKSEIPCVDAGSNHINVSGR